MKLKSYLKGALKKIWALRERVKNKASSFKVFCKNRLIIYLFIYLFVIISYIDNIVIASAINIILVAVSATKAENNLKIMKTTQRKKKWLPCYSYSPSTAIEKMVPVSKWSVPFSSLLLHVVITCTFSCPCFRIEI